MFCPLLDEFTEKKTCHHLLSIICEQMILTEYTIIIKINVWTFSPKRHNECKKFDMWREEQVNTHIDIRCVSPPGRSCVLSECNSIEIGIPTFLERPITSTFFPAVSMPK